MAGGGGEDRRDMVGRLLDFAGPRQQAPADLLAEVKRRAHPVWQAKVEAHARTRRRRDRFRWLAAAAVLLVGAGMLNWQRGQDVRTAAAVFVARVETVLDAGRVGSGGLAVGDRLEAGSGVETAAGGRAALRLASGASLRLDGATLVRLESPTVLVLQRGAVYLDSGPAGGGGLEVRTPFGVARDVGTQFEVRLGGGALQVRVREGEVELEVEDTSHRVAAGGAISVASDGTVELEDISGYGPEWRWVLAAAPSFDAEGRTLGELLDWVARETGWRPRFAEPELEREARATKLHGSVAGLAPDQVPDLVLPSSGLQYRLEDGILLIERASPEG